MSTHYIAGVAVEVEGTGAPVVCIHGLGGTTNTWVPLMRALRDRLVIRIDLPGSGRSPAGVDALNIERMVEVVAQVCRQLDISGAVFLGHSMGSIVCQHIAVRHPSLVKALALFGPLVCPPEPARPNIRARADKARGGGAVAMQEIANAIVQGATSALTREVLPVAVAMVRESLMRQDAVGYARSCEALADAQSAALEDIAVPVLLVTGDEDGVAPPAAVREMARRLPNARVEVFNRCGHWTTFERPVECAEQLEAFLRRP
ncbi:alpha/beta fold hydrolase [Hydrogenophaga sp.]|uniref:alpha/beta fold hydrolase n=1 Tax=Hydrogenophaga sp. TaxID=1904254 RepID=UPI002730AF28|nr:alpha/beta hydrolase [Hydrogenophaga sp.]MDP2017338.1 alpha/beta hydrolase [Hydrogenophaga sp.]MDP3168588.1 alpha/beta hydrolase [Hydrogenophaga sp.]MDP3812565.1 alpha/beta hydrolase [Hydrogenophaga sp.]